MGTLKTTNIQTITGSGTLTLGTSGETLTVPSGVTVAGTLTNKPAFHVYNSSATSIPDNTWTKVNTQTAIFDTDSWLDTGNNRITVPAGTTSGYMLFNWSVRMNLDGIGDNTSAALRKNGSQISQQLKFYNGPEAEAMGYTNSIISSYAAGDYFEIYAFQDNASNVAKNTNPSSSDTYITGMRLIGV